MMAISLRARFSFRDALRLLGVAAALLTLSTVASQRAEALSPVNPGMAGTSKTIANGPTIEVRGGHGGGGVGGGRGFGGAVVGGGAIGAGAAVAAGSPRFAGRTFIHRRHFGGV